MTSTLQHTLDEQGDASATPADSNALFEGAVEEYKSYAANAYNWLSYRENNIELLEAHPSSSYEYLRESRTTKVQRYLFKRKMRSWGRRVSYVCRKIVADARLRVKGRFITRTQAS